MKIDNLELKDAFVIHPSVFSDNRGWFMESYNESSFPIKTTFIQDNHSMSVKKNTIRGLHIQCSPYLQAKLVRCVRGGIYDIIVDVRPSSPTYLKSQKILLTEENKDILFVPRGFLHGFVTLFENTEVMYKVDNVYNKESERSILYSDPLFNIDWGEGDFILSEKDLKAPLYKNSDLIVE